MTASKIKVALVPGWASQPGTLFYYMNKENISYKLKSMYRIIYLSYKDKIC